VFKLEVGEQRIRSDEEHVQEVGSIKYFAFKPVGFEVNALFPLSEKNWSKAFFPAVVLEVVHLNSLLLSFVFFFFLICFFSPFFPN
jgi:hypothetical protein